MDGDGPSLASIEREGVVVFSKRSCEQSDSVQLDWPSETDTLKINLPRDREGYNRFEYKYVQKALDEAHPMVWGPKLHFYFLGYF